MEKKRRKRHGAFYYRGPYRDPYLRGGDAGEVRRMVRTQASGSKLDESLYDDKTDRQQEIIIRRLGGHIFLGGFPNPLFLYIMKQKFNQYYVRSFEEGNNYQATESLYEQLWIVRLMIFLNLVIYTGRLEEL